MNLPVDSLSANSRSSSTYASTSIRPRAKRFITGFEAFSQEHLGDSSTTSALISPSISAHDSSPFYSRVPSPIPSTHPSRASSLRPPTNRNPSGPDVPNNDLANSLTGLWSKSWTSLQGLASNVLGSDITADHAKDSGGRRSRRGTPSSSRPGTSSKQWGPAPIHSTQLAGGSKQERSALVRAKKRDELLAANDTAFNSNAALNYKRRLSDDFAASAQAQADDRDVPVYVHHVTARDTLAGISIRYNCQLVLIKKVNRMWSNDVLAKKTIILPVDKCNIRGRKVPGPDEAESELLGGDGSGDGDSDRQHAVQRGRRTSTVTITPSNAGSNGHHDDHAPPSPGKTQEDNNPWTHDSWILLEGQTEPTEIARLPYSGLGYFPRARRKSGSLSDLERSSASLEMARPSIAISEGSSGRRSIQKSRRSSGSNQFAAQMIGPGGVGSLKGRGPSTPGPAEDKLSKVFRQQLPGAVRIPNASDDEYLASAASTPGFAEFGQAVEVWAKKVSKGLAKALEPPPSNQPWKQRRAVGFSSTASGDLIELETAFEIGEDEVETPTNNNHDRGRRGSFAGLNGSRLTVDDRPSRSRSHGIAKKGYNAGNRRKGD